MDGAFSGGDVDHRREFELVKGGLVMPSYWESPWQWGLLIAACGVAARAKRFLPRQYHKFYALWIACLMSAWALATGRLFWASAPLHPSLDALSAAGFNSFALVLLLPAAILLVPGFRHWRRVFSGLALLESWQILTQGYGWLNSSSFGGAMLACSLPMLPWPARIPAALAALASQSVTAWVVITAMGAAYLVHRGASRALAGYGAAGVAAFWLLRAQSIPHMGTRLAGWKAAFHWIVFEAPPAAWLTGTGLGSFAALGPSLPITTGEIWLQLHSDWFQVFFELGFIGLALLLLAFYRISQAAQALPRPGALMSLWGIAACGLTYYPLRSFWGMLFLLCLVREILENKSWLNSFSSTAQNATSSLNQLPTLWVPKSGAPVVGTLATKSP